MESLVEQNQLDFEKMMHLHLHGTTFSENFLPYYQLCRKLNKTKGSLVKCGITENNFSSFSTFTDCLHSDTIQNSIAFEKFSHGSTSQKEIHYIVGKKLQQKKLCVNKNVRTSFIKGSIGESIPAYLIENPELKIAFLQIDLDDYEATLTTLQFFYPRLAHGGVLVLDNYHKHKEDYEAVNDYFFDTKISLNNFALNSGPHYFIRD